MNELVKFLVGKLVDDPTQVEIEIQDKGEAVEMIVRLPQAEMGKVIGKQGRIAKAIRTIVKAASAREKKKYSVEISEKE